MPGVASGLIELVPIHFHLGDIKTARRLFTLRDARVAGLSDEVAAIIGCVETQLLAAEGRYAESLEVATNIVNLMPVLPLLSTSIKRAIAQGTEAALVLGDLDAADRMLDIVRQARPGMVSPSLRGHAARLGARLSAMRGEHDSVEAGFTSAIAEFREVGALFELGAALLELAEWLSGRGRHAEAQHFAVEARSLFEQLGARPWLERVQPLLGVEPPARFVIEGPPLASAVGGSIGALPQ